MAILRMKVSYGIFLVGIIVLILEIMIATNLDDSGNVLKGLVSENMLDKISTLYFFIIIISFFFGGIVFFLEKGVKIEHKTQFSEAEFDLEGTDLNEEYLEYVKTRSTEVTH